MIKTGGELGHLILQINILFIFRLILMLNISLFS